MPSSPLLDPEVLNKRAEGYLPHTLGLEFLSATPEEVEATRAMLDA